MEKEKNVIKKVVDGLAQSTKKAHAGTKASHEVEKKAFKERHNNATAKKTFKERKAEQQQKIGELNPHIKARREAQK